MRIAIDARSYAWTGIGRYIRNLLREYASSASAADGLIPCGYAALKVSGTFIKVPDTFIVLIPFGKKADFLARVPLPSDRFEIIEVEGSYYSWAEQTTFLWQLNRIKADLFHFTHFNIPIFFRRPYVVTIHDTTRFIFPGQKKPGLWQQMAYEFVFAQAVTNARGLISVSNTTLTELKKLPIRLPPISQVIYEGVGENFFAKVSDSQKTAVRALLPTASPYLLYVGVWMTHKNLLRLLQAFALVKKTRPDLKLVITGRSQAAYSDVKGYAQTLGLQTEVIFPGFVSAQLLPALYEQAACFCFPSLYEGFGLPPLEAAAVGTPVVTSNVSSLPEIMGQSAQFVNPEDEADIAAGILQALEPNRKAQLTSLGKTQAKKFSWGACAKQTLTMYQAVSCKQ